MLAAYEEMKTQEVFSSNDRPQHSLPLPLPSASPAASALLPSSSATAAASNADKYRLLANDGQPPRSSLVLYDAPQPISRPHQPSAAAVTVTGNKRKSDSAKAAAVGGESRKAAAQLSEVLNAILPPVDCGLDAAGVRLVRRVSLDASSREQVIALQRMLDEQLQERQARSVDIRHSAHCGAAAFTGS